MKLQPPRTITPLLDKTATRSQYKEQKKFPEYLAKLRQCPCLICKRTPSEAAHLRMSSAEYGKVNGRDDKWANPICGGDHRLYPDAQHNYGEAEWWKMKGIDPLPIAKALWEARNDLEKMIEIASRRY